MSQGSVVARVRLSLAVESGGLHGRQGRNEKRLADLAGRGLLLKSVDS
jgi:hypothetical protein